jgi:hypothetical protein
MSNAKKIKDHVDMVNGLPSSMEFNWSQKMLDIHIDNLINTWGHNFFFAAVNLNLDHRDILKRIKDENLKINDIITKNKGVK